MYKSKAMNFPRWRNVGSNPSSLLQNPQYVPDFQVRIDFFSCLLVLMELIRAIEDPLMVALNLMLGNSLPRSKDCTRGASCKPTTARVAANVVGVSTVMVSGMDLTQYMQPPSDDTPFDRFLKAENGLGRLATLPGSSRTHKL